MSHSFEGVEDQGCAYLEGFAHFLAVATRGPAGARYYGVHNRNPDTLGYRIERNFAGFLYDLVDPMYGESEEPYDGLSLPVPYVREVISDCMSRESGSWMRATKTSAIAYCIENNASDFWLPGADFDLVSWVGTIPGGAAASEQVRELGSMHLLDQQTPLQVSISGAAVIDASGTYQWEAMPKYGSGAYAYTWDYQPSGSSTWSQVGTGKTYSRYVSTTGPEFSLRVTVTSGSDTARTIYWVMVQPDLGSDCPNHQVIC